MARVPIVKELIGTRLASTYGGWMYCDNCGKNLGYLCYVTYDSFQFEYQCKCGSHGSMHIAFTDASTAVIAECNLIINRNRLCCPSDMSPLFTILEKNLDSYHYEVICNKCNVKYAN